MDTPPAPAPATTNPAPALDTLRPLAAALRAAPIREHFRRDPRRVQRFSRQGAGWHLDFSRHLLDEPALGALLALAEQADFDGARQALFDGHAINHTEGRAALHTLLRGQPQAGLSQPDPAQSSPAQTAQTQADPTQSPPAQPDPAQAAQTQADPAQANSAQSTPAPPDLAAKQQAVADCLNAMADWVERVHTGQHRGHGGATITDVVNLGIGGSDLGPRMVVEALAPRANTPTRAHFVANIDPAELHQTLAPLDPARTLFIVCSKTLGTEETLHNAQAARRWLLDGGTPEAALGQHFLAVSTRRDRAGELGIPPRNILPLWDWVGGRYSLWSGIGWSIAFALGMGGFRELLAGARAMDEHFRHTPAAGNLPLALSLLEVWYVNGMGAQTHAVVPYDHCLRRLPAFLQQLSMESNGKSATRDGAPARHDTAPVLWGDEGSNGQHSFHQLLHQGTRLCPVDFILPLRGRYPADPEGHRRLVANCLAQGQALLEGRDLEQSRQSLLERGLAPNRAAALAPHLVIPGNRPSSTLSCEELTPHALGALLALYEHKTFCSGLLWQVNSFDQWGVELGKELGARVLGAMAGTGGAELDPSTAALVERWRRAQGISNR